MCILKPKKKINKCISKILFIYFLIFNLDKNTFQTMNNDINYFFIFQKY